MGDAKKSELPLYPAEILARFHHILAVNVNGDNLTDVASEASGSTGLVHVDNVTKFLEGTEAARNLTIFINTRKKTRKEVQQALESQFVKVEPASWCPSVLLIKQRPVNLTLEHSCEALYYIYFLQYEIWASLPLSRISECLVPKKEKEKMLKEANRRGIMHIRKWRERYFSKSKANRPTMAVGYKSRALRKIRAKYLIGVKYRRSPCIEEEEEVEIPTEREMKGETDIEKVNKRKKEEMIGETDIEKLKEIPTEREMKGATDIEKVKGRREREMIGETDIETINKRREREMIGGDTDIEQVSKRRKREMIAKVDERREGDSSLSRKNYSLIKKYLGKTCIEEINERVKEKQAGKNKIEDTKENEENTTGKIHSLWTEKHIKSDIEDVNERESCGKLGRTSLWAEEPNKTPDYVSMIPRGRNHPAYKLLLESLKQAVLNSGLYELTEKTDKLKKAPNYYAEYYYAPEVLGRGIEKTWNDEEGWWTKPYDIYRHLRNPRGPEREEPVRVKKRGRIAKIENVMKRIAQRTFRKFIRNLIFLDDCMKKKEKMMMDTIWLRWKDLQEHDDYRAYLDVNRDPRIPLWNVTRQAKQESKLKPPQSKILQSNISSQNLYYGGQGVSGVFPVLALGLKPGNSLLDLCAARGHHTYIAGVLMRDQGLVVSNCLTREYLNTLYHLVERCGLTSTIITHHHLVHFPKALKEFFSHVLVDAPCTGIGSIKKSELISSDWNYIEKIKTAVRFQKYLVRLAISSLQPNGHLVYCTSSVLVEENEEVVSYALGFKGMQLVQIELPFGEPGIVQYGNMRFDESMKLCKRLYPHLHNTPSLFLAKMKKCDGVIQKKCDRVPVIPKKCDEVIRSRFSPPLDSHSHSSLGSSQRISSLEFSPISSPQIFDW